MENLNPQAEIFGVWRRWSAATRQSTGELRWRDAANSSNSILDAELLTCLLLPATQLTRFDLSQFNTATPDAVRSLHAPQQKPSGPQNELDDRDMAHVMSMIEEFFEKNTVGDRPSFSVGSYSTLPGDVNEQRKKLAPTLEVSDSYALSISVCIYSLLLVTAWQSTGSDTVEKTQATWENIRQRAGRRLDYALAGLLSSFCVNSMPSGEYQRNTGHAWPGRDPDMQRLRDNLNAMGAKIGSANAFNLGWSWGRIHPDKRFTTDLDLPNDLDDAQEVAALPAPYFYFTVSALDSISGLNDRRVQAANFLTPQQLTLTSRLLQFWHMTIDYWTRLAFAVDSDTGRWAIEDVPWTAADGEATDYWSLYLMNIVTRGDAQEGHRLTAGDLGRMIPLAEDLANRARITRRPVPSDSDPALALHSPGHSVTMLDSEGQPVLLRRVYDFAPRLLKLCGRLLSLTSDEDARERTLALTNQIWRHVGARRLDPVTDTRGDASSSWDTLKDVYPDFEDTREMTASPVASLEDRVASWYMSERTVEALVAITEASLRSKPETMSVNQIVQELGSDLRYLTSSALTEGMDVAGEEFNDLLRLLNQAATEESASLALALLIRASERLEKWKMSGEAR